MSNIEELSTECITPKAVKYLARVKAEMDLLRETILTSQANCQLSIDAIQKMLENTAMLEKRLAAAKEAIKMQDIMIAKHQEAWKSVYLTANIYKA